MTRRQGQEGSIIVSKRQFRILMLLAVISGLVGGGLSDLLFRGLAARAAQTTTAAKVIEAQEFRLVDSDGEKRGALQFSDVLGEPELSLYDAAGQGRASLELMGGDARLSMRDAAGNDRVGLYTDQDGASILGLWDAAGNPRVSLGCRPDGCPLLNLLDAAGEARVMIAGDERPSFHMSGLFGVERAMVTLGFDENGRSLLNLHDACKTGAQLSSAPGLWLLDDTGEPQLSLTTALGQGGALSLMGSEGMVRAGFWVLGNSGRLWLSGEKGQERVSLVESPQGARLAISDAAGRNRAVVGSATTVTKRTGAETKYPESTIRLFKENGDVLWQAP